uniref:Uncharacterized protein n=1 Tax=Myoviridae sp. ctfrL10 TaxID=2826678 RepID=A0A8S5MRW4_9CAUD|nr:MAG TPA: hypothetical protein [Myoviridae sp. ctfrL10]DAN83404.1 MAG TPA: hypothetical protein [Caudoviricetes sp.]
MRRSKRQSLIALPLLPSFTKNTSQSWYNDK